MLWSENSGLLRQTDVKSQAIGTSLSRHFEIQSTTELAIQRKADTVEITIENMESIPENCQASLCNVFDLTLPVLCI